MAAWKLRPTLAAGNVIVLKSAKQTPLLVLLFATLIEKAGFPPGVITIVMVSVITGAHLARHNSVAKIGLMESNTGREIIKLDTNNLEDITLETGGKPLLIVFQVSSGYFIKPTIFTNVKGNTKIYREQISRRFGVIVSFETEDEAVKRTNDTEYGLGAALFTENITRAHDISKSIKDGTIKALSRE